MNKLLNSKFNNTTSKIINTYEYIITNNFEMKFQSHEAELNYDKVNLTNRVSMDLYPIKFIWIKICRQQSKCLW